MLNNNCVCVKLDFNLIVQNVVLRSSPHTRTHTRTRLDYFAALAGPATLQRMNGTNCFRNAVFNGVQRIPLEAMTRWQPTPMNVHNDVFVAPTHTCTLKGTFGHDGRVSSCWQLSLVRKMLAFDLSILGVVRCVGDVIIPEHKYPIYVRPFVRHPFDCIQHDYNYVPSVITHQASPSNAMNATMTNVSPGKQRRCVRIRGSQMAIIGFNLDAIDVSCVCSCAFSGMS